MERRNVTDHQGSIHEGLFNSHTGFLIDLACGVGRYQVVHQYHSLDPARLTEEALTCPSCQEIDAAGPDAPQHLADVARPYAQDVLDLADSRGRPPALDNEGLRLALEDLHPGEAPSVKLYPVIREHLVDQLTERAMAAQDGVPEVLAEYERYTGGKLQAPVGPGDRLMYNGIASGHWTIYEVQAVEDTPDGVFVTLRHKAHGLTRYEAEDVPYWFFKLDRGPIPAASGQAA